MNVSGSSDKGQVKFWKQAKLSVIIFFLMSSNFGRALLSGAPTARCKLVFLPSLGILTYDNLLNRKIKKIQKTKLIFLHFLQFSSNDYLRVSTS